MRLKLLEVYAETGDRAAFDEHMGALVEHCEEEDALLAARELETRFGEAAISLDESEDADAGAMDFELELDDLEELDDSEAPVPGATAPNGESVAAEARGAGDELGGDLGMDFDPEEADDLTADAADTAASPFEADTEEMKIDQALEDAASELEQSKSFDASGSLGADSAMRAAAQDEALDDLEFEAVATADDDFEFQDEGDSANTKLDLARAYIDMGDADGARDILKEVLDEGNSDQQQKAQTMLETL